MAILRLTVARGGGEARKQKQGKGGEIASGWKDADDSRDVAVAFGTFPRKTLFCRLSSIVSVDCRILPLVASDCPSFARKLLAYSHVWRDRPPAATDAIVVWLAEERGDKWRTTFILL